MKNRSAPKNILSQPNLQLKSPTIGVFIKHSAKREDGYYAAILAGITEAAYEQNINLLHFIGSSLSKSPDPAHNKQRNILYELATPDSVDGLIIVDTVGNVRSPKELVQLHARKNMLPTVSVGAALPGIPSLVVDNEIGLREALVHLIETHHYRRFAFIGGPNGNEEGAERLRLFKEILSQHNILIDKNLITHGDYSVASGAKAMRRLLEKASLDFEVVVAANDNMALGALEALRGHGTVVPYDVAVIGFDNIKQAETVTPTLTTVHQPLFNLGKQSVETILDQIAQNPILDQTILPTSLVIRRSCGCIEEERKQSSQSIHQTADSLFEANSDIFLATLSEHLHFKNEAIMTSLNSWLNQLFDAFLSDCRDETKNQFLFALDQWTRLLITNGENIEILQELITQLHQNLEENRKQHVAYHRADIILHRARRFIAHEALRVQKQHLLHVEQQNALLHSITQSLSSTLDVPKIIDLLANNLPRLDIPSCYLVLYEDPKPYIYPQSPPARAFLHLAYDHINGRIPLPTTGKRFSTQTLLPENTLPVDRTYTMTIEALFFQTTQIGYILFERGKHASDVYETLRGQLSSALNGALLLQKNKQVEKELRQHQQHLDTLVQERTIDLLAANEHLQQEIRERQHAEKQLSQTVSLLQNVINASQDLIFVKDTQLRTILCNNIFAQAMGKKPADLYGKTDIENGWSPELVKGMPEQGIRGFEADDRDALAGMTVYNPEDLANINGEIRVFDTIKTPLRDETGNITGVLGVSRDITERKQSEEALRTSEAKYRLLFENTNAGIILFDTKGTYLMLNEHIAAVLGGTPADFIGKSIHQLFPEQAAFHMQRFAKIIAEKKGATFEDPFPLPDGVRWYSSNLQPVIDEHDTVIGIQIVAIDITERKLAEAELQQSQRNLAYAQKIAKVAYYYWHIETNEVAWSDEMYRIFGVDKSTFMPQANTFGQFLHPDDLHFLSEENFAKMMSDRTHHMELRIFDQSTNTLKHLYLWGETTFADEGHPLTIFGIIQDITERRIAEIQLEAYAAELERSNQDLQEFAYVASHDLQEPLRKIQTFGDRLQNKYYPVLGERGLNYVNRMQSAASRMQGLIVDLLAFSRVHTHTQPFHKVNLNQVVHYVLQNLEITVEETDAQITIEQLPTIDADLLQMRQLFQNLFSNALKFNYPDTPPVIDISSTLENSYCTISIRDNGIGFDEKYLDRIFTVFERLHNRDEYPGTGIGLAICRRIVERHQGNITAHSKIGNGATFVVTLPLNQQLTPEKEFKV